MQITKTHREAATAICAMHVKSQGNKTRIQRKLNSSGPDNTDSHSRELQAWGSLGFLRFFVTVTSSGLDLSPLPNPQLRGPGTALHYPGWTCHPFPTPDLEDQAQNCVLLLPLHLPGKGGTTSSLHSRQHSSPRHWDAHAPPRQGARHPESNARSLQVRKADLRHVTSRDVDL
jgi:hypothetical protein